MKSRLSTVKTSESRRNVSMGEYIENRLVNYKEDCSKDPDYALNNFVFFNGVEKPVSYNAINSAKQKYVKLSGVKRITIHGFRHSRASYLIHYSEPGQIAAVAQMLGHSINECLKTYAHFYSNDMKNIIDRGENKIPQEIIITQNGINEDGSPNIKMTRQMIGYTTDEELTNEDRETLKELENLPDDYFDLVDSDDDEAFIKWFTGNEDE